MSLATRKRIAVFLTNADNPHQQHLRTVALAEAPRLGADVEVQFAGSELEGSAVSQIQQVYEATSSTGRRYDAVIVHPVSGPGSERIVQNLVRAGLPCFVLNRTFEGLEALRKESPNVPFACISPDQVEVGRIQGRQFLRLHDGAGVLLYVQGPLLATAAQQRLAGMQEIIRSSRLQERRLAGEWLTAKAAAAVENWFATGGAGASLPDVIGCQNDSMAVGVCEALDRLAAQRGEPALRRIPVTGCDGAANYGAALVRQGKLAATVELGDPMISAFEMLQRYFGTCEIPPLEVRLPVRSLPDLSHLKPVARA